ncbi:MAG: flagellar type III secretion system protein FliR [Nitrospinae bacterium]|nr:flagellar type III secretion system protein FliR [Nitrospinota bacterium]
MNLFNFDIPHLMTFMLVFIRLGGLIFTMPVFGASTIPTQMKVGLAGLVAFVVFSVAKIPTVDVTMPMGKYIYLLGGEVMIGLIIGFASQFLFNAVEFAGDLVGIQIGFGIVNVLDPTTSSQIGITSQFLNTLALLVFLAINGHHWFIMAAVKSFDVLPLMGFAPHAGLTDLFISLTAQVMVLAIKLSAPVVATILLLNIGLGLIARTVPQMNVFIVGFPLQISLGLFILGMSMPTFYEILRHYFGAFPETALSIMKLL